MAILQQLGINFTAVIQSIFFIFSIGFLSFFVFGPYAKALEERHRRTKGGETDALELHGRATELHAEYEVTAKQAHAEISGVYLKRKQEVTNQVEEIIQQARQEANQKVDASRKIVQKELEGAKTLIHQEATQLASLMVQKLLGKKA